MRNGILRMGGEHGWDPVTKAEELGDELLPFWNCALALVKISSARNGFGVSQISSVEMSMHECMHANALTDPGSCRPTQTRSTTSFPFPPGSASAQRFVFLPIKISHKTIFGQQRHFIEQHSSAKRKKKGEKIQNVSIVPISDQSSDCFD